MANANRIYYANQQVGIMPQSEAESGGLVFSSGHEVHGVQSVSSSITFNNEQVFELAQAPIYENTESLADIEWSLQKVFDGYPMLLHLATYDAPNPTLAGRSAARATLGLSIFPDTLQSASGTPTSTCVSSGLFPTSWSATFGVGSPFTEDITLIGNHRIWKNVDGHPGYAGVTLSPTFTGERDSIDFDGMFASGTDAPTANGGVQRQENMIFEFDTGSPLDINGMVGDPDATILPPDVYGITASGTNEDNVVIQSISVSVDLSREEFEALGTFGPVFRAVEFPVEVTTEIEATSVAGDMVSVADYGIFSTGTGTCDNISNLKDRTIRVATCDGTRIYTGVKNKLESVNYGGGDAGGGNVSVTYTYTTFNDLTVLHPEDPNPSGIADDWWGNRSTYLVDTP